MEVKKYMNTLPIIQTFFNKPVRFFKTDFWPELCHRYGDKDTRKYLLETWAIPLIDFAEAVDYPRQKIHEIINRNIESFQDYFKTESIVDRGGTKKRATLLLALEMCDALTMRLQASRIQDPVARERVIHFQRWVPIAFHIIRTGKLRGVRWNIGQDIPKEMLQILSLPPGRETHEAVKEMAEKENKSEQQIYRRLQQTRGSNAITRKGIPKKERFTKGAYRNTPEFKTVEFIHCQLPMLKKKETARIAGVAYGKVLRWLRAA
jgi:hypothetical protein